MTADSLAEAAQVIERVDGLVWSRTRMLRRLAAAHRRSAAQFEARAERSAGLAAEHLGRARELEAELDRPAT